MAAELTTYLLGAGASVGAIPLSVDLPGQFMLLKSEIERTDFKGEPLSDVFAKDTPASKVLADFCDSLEWLQSVSIGKSVDAVARGFDSASDTASVLRLKATLSAYLLIEQSKSHSLVPPKYDFKVDPRCEVFFSKISRREGARLVLRDDYRVLSWNYDLQPELAIQKLLSSHDIAEAYECLNSVPALGGRPAGSNAFSVLRFNGVAGLFTRISSQEIDVGPRIGTDFTLDLLREVLLVYWYWRYWYREVTPLLVFAWEDWKHRQQLLEQAKEVLRNTRQLIIIGYSFPDFNRHIDKSVFEALNPDVETVFIQNAPTGKGVKWNRRVLESWFPWIGSKIVEEEIGTDYFIPPDFSIHF